MTGTITPWQGPLVQALISKPANTCNMGNTNPCYMLHFLVLVLAYGSLSWSRFLAQLVCLYCTYFVSA
jgi:hypothetical protein